MFGRVEGQNTTAVTNQKEYIDNIGHFVKITAQKYIFIFMIEKKSMTYLRAVFKKNIDTEAVYAKIEMNNQ